MGQDEAAAAPDAPAPDAESAPEFPPQRGPETVAPHRVPAQRPDADEDGDRDRPDEAETGDEDETEPGAGAEPQPPAQDPAAPGLGTREREVLDFERRRWKHVGAKEQAIRDEFGLSPTHYYQILNALLDDPAALAYRPALVNRLRRTRDARRRERR